MSALVSARCKIWKEQHLSFHWKKINVVAFFDDFLSLNELWRVLGGVNSFLRNGISGIQNREETGKLNAMSNKKWFVCRTVMIQRAPYSPDLGECFIYSERTRTTHEIFSTGFWSHNLRHKPTKSGGAWQSFRNLNVKNPLESHFFFDKTCIVCHTVMIQRALHSPDLGKCFTYSKHLRTTHEKISTGFWIQILWQKHTQNYSSKMSWVHLRLFKVHLNLKNHEKTLRH